MPFPLLSLPYGFRRRLVELSTPFEAYSIQVAAPDFTGFCQPVKVTTMQDLGTNYLKFDGRNNQFYDDLDNPVAVGEYELRALGGGLETHNVLKLDINHFILSHSPLITFICCHIDLPFVEKLCSNLSTKLSEKPKLYPPLLCLQNCTYDSDVTKHALYHSLFNHFMLIVWKPFPKQPEGVNGLLNANLTGLFHLELELTKLTMLNIDPNILLKFFMMQHERFLFDIRIRVKDPDAKIQKKIRALLSNNFKFSPIIVIPLHEPKRYLRFYYSNKCRRYELITNE